MSKTNSKFFIVAFFTFMTCSVFAVANDFQLEYAVDSSNTLSFSEVNELDYKDAESPVLNFGVQPYTYWVKVKLDTSHPDRDYLSLRRALWDSLTFYFRDTLGVLHTKQFGYYINTDLKDKTTNFPFLLMDVNNILNNEVYIKGNNRYAMIFPVSRETEMEFYKNNLQGNIFDGLLIGGLFIMCIYNFFLWLMLRDKSYLHYVLTVLISIFIQIGLHNYSSYFVELTPTIDYSVIRVNMVLGIITNSIFAFEFLSIKKHSKFFYWVLMGICIFTCVPVVLDFIGASHLAIKLVMFDSLLTAMTLMIIGYVFWLNKKLKIAMYYSLAWTVFIIGFIIYLFKSNGLLPHTWFTNNFVHIGRFIEISLLSFALGYRYNELKRDKEKIQKQLTNELGDLVEQRTAALNETLKEKEVLLNEVHHRVKNNLQIINSMLAIQSRRFPDAIKGLLTSVQNRIGSISLVHEQLYTDKLFSTLNAKEYLTKMIRTLEDSLIFDEANISIEIKTDNKIQIPIDVAIPFGLILNEIISNAIKYAFNENDNGIISVSLFEEQGALVLEAKDNGRGKTDTDEVKRSSMGIRIIEDMSRQLNAQLSLTTDGGYCYRIEIPR